MMTTGCIKYLGFTFVIVMVLLTGCRGLSPPVDFYTLNSQVNAPEDAAADENIAIGVGPMELPQSIDRPQIVTRTGPSKLVVDEFHRWAGSLPEDILRVITENLSVLLKSNQITAYPWEGHFKPDYRIVLDVQRFDGSPGEEMVLNVTWTITDAGGRNALFVKKSMIKEPVAGMDFDALVSAKNQALATLSREIAREIIKLESAAEGS